jgi:hypothetical protein
MSSKLISCASKGNVKPAAVRAATAMTQVPLQKQLSLGVFMSRVGGDWAHYRPKLSRRIVLIG